MSCERFLLITANFNFLVVYLGTPKRQIEKKGWKKVFELELDIVDLKVEQEEVNMAACHETTEERV